MDEIFERSPQRRPAPWPGLRFGIDTQKAKALLGTPSGLATAWLLIDRVKELGRRKLWVTIAASPDAAGGALDISGGPPQLGYRMIWDMEPM